MSEMNESYRKESKYRIYSTLVQVPEKTSIRIHFVVVVVDPTPPPKKTSRNAKKHIEP